MRTEPWALVDDVTKPLGIAKSSAHRRIETHHLLAHDLGRLWKFKLPEVNEWVRSNGADASDDKGHLQ